MVSTKHSRATFADVPQQLFACSKSSIETSEKGLKYVEVNNKETKTTSSTLPENVRKPKVFYSFLTFLGGAEDVIPVSLLLPLNIFHTFF